MNQVLQEGLTSNPGQFFQFVSKNRYKILTNILFNGSPGAQIAELDYFLRKYWCGDVPRDGKYLWIQSRTHLTRTLAEVYGSHFRQYNLDMLAYSEIFQAASKVTRMMPELGVDVGVTQVKSSVMSRDNIFVVPVGDGTYYSTTNDAVMQTYRDYYRLHAATLDFDPWTPARPAIDGPLADLMGGNLDRVAVVHFRTTTGNAGLVIPPETMFPALGYLRDCGFTVVKGGTEAYPPEFKRFGVVNYSDSDLRCYRNDLAMLTHCKLALINSSGLENIVDLMRIPLVSFARWHLTLGPFSRTGVIVPTLLYHPTRGTPLSFAEQMLVFRTRPEFGECNFFTWSFPEEEFKARNPQPDEILAAVQEAIALGEGPRPISPLQERFNRLDQNGLLPLMQSRVSEFFLNRFQDLL